MRPTALAFAMVILACGAARGQDGDAAKDPRNLTWIEEGKVALGGGGLSEADVEWLASQGFGAIADMRAESQDPEALIAAKGMTFFDMPIDSASNINSTQLATFVAWADAQIADGRIVYVHCTNGWHRAAAFAAAWEMAADNDGFDEVAREIVAERPGTAMRAPSALLDFQATRTGKAGLAVVLVSPISRPELGGEMPVEVHVEANGAPVADARVRVWSEESRLAIDGTTDADGRFPFVYKAPLATFMDHLYARASSPDFIDGADNVEFIFEQKVSSRPALEVSAERDAGGIFVTASHHGRALPVRVVASAPGWTAFESSDAGSVYFPAAPDGAVDIRVVSWGSEGGAASVPPEVSPGPPPAATPTPAPPTAVPPAAPPPASPAPPAASPPAPIVIAPRGTDVEPPATEPAHSLASRYATIALAWTVVLGAYVYASRRRAGVGNR